MLGGIKSAVQVKPMLVAVGYMAMINGQYLPGKFGASILNGGLGHTTAFSARSNSYKSTLLSSMMYSAMYRYNCPGLFDDREMTNSIQRQQDLCKRIAPTIDLYALTEEDKYKYTDAREYTGTEIFTVIKQILAPRIGNKKMMVETPFIDNKGVPIMMLSPFIWGEDSLSYWRSDATEEQQAKFEVGSKERMDESRKAGLGKSQMVGEWSTMTTRTGTFIVTSAHVGDDNTPQEGNIPNPKRMATLPHKSKFKGIPENFAFSMTDVYIIKKAKALREGNSSTGSALYPRFRGDDRPGDTDLNLLDVLTGRSKSGITGVVYPVMVSQSEGYLDGLTCFHFLKDKDYMDGYGLIVGGNNSSFKPVIYPEATAVSRHTIRQELDKDPKFCRALELTAELAILVSRWTYKHPELLCTPEELYEGIKEKGYDWDEILQTRGYWTFDHWTNPIRCLSMEDLLKMRAGLYVPYWKQSAWQDEYGKKEKK